MSSCATAGAGDIGGGGCGGGSGGGVVVVAVSKVSTIAFILFQCNVLISYTMYICLYRCERIKQYGI